MFAARLGACDPQGCSRVSSAALFIVFTVPPPSPPRVPRVGERWFRTPFCLIPQPADAVARPQHWPRAQRPQAGAQARAWARAHALARDWHGHRHPHEHLERGIDWGWVAKTRFSLFATPIPFATPRPPESTLAPRARRAKFPPIFPVVPHFPPFFVPVLGTPEKAGMMWPFRPHGGPQDGRG